MSNEDVGTFVAQRVAEELGWVEEEVIESSENDTMVKNEQNELKASREKNNLPSNTVEGEVLATVGDDLLAACLDKGSRDNMSVLIVALPASCVMSCSTSPQVALASNENKDANSTIAGAVRALDYDA